MSLTARRALLWSATAVWAGVIFAFSATPGSKLPGGYSVQAHFTEYFILGGLLYLALRVDLPARAALLAVALASLYAVSDEFHQSFVPLRTPDPVDWAIDTVGATAGVAVAWLALRLIAKRGSAEGSG